MAGCAICRFCFRVEHSIAIFSSQSTKRGSSKDVLEAVFSVKVEAGDGMSDHASRTCFSAAQNIHLSSTSCKQWLDKATVSLKTSGDSAAAIIHSLTVENGENIQITMIPGNWCTCTESVYQPQFFTIRLKEKSGPGD